MSATAITEAPGEPVVATCFCGRTYTRAEWEGLPRLRDQHSAGDVYEVRNCKCGSTKYLLISGSET